MPPKRSTSAGKAKAAKVAKVEEVAPDVAVETKSAGSSKKAAAPASTYVERSETPRKVCVVRLPKWYVRSARVYFQLA